MSKKIVKAKDVKIGHYYADKNSVVRIDKFDRFGEPEGVMVCFFENYLSVLFQTDCFYIFEEDNEVIEISQEEFEQKLQEAQEHFTKMINQVKNNNNEETTA